MKTKVKIGDVEFELDVEKAKEAKALTRTIPRVRACDLQEGDVYTFTKDGDSSLNSKLVLLKTYDNRWHCFGLFGKLQAYSNRETGIGSDGAGGYTAAGLANYLNGRIGDSTQWFKIGNIQEGAKAALAKIVA